MEEGATVKNPITVATNAAFPTLRKGKAFKALVFVASKVFKNLAPGSIHSVPLSFLRDLLRIKLSNREIAQIIEDLEKTKVDWAAYDKKYKGYSHIVPSCRYDEEKDTITFTFDPLFVQEFLDEKTPFKNIPIEFIMGFKSNYAMKIYELAYQYYDPKRKKGKTPDYAYEDLRKLFGLGEDQYHHKGHFFNRVINGPLKEAIEVSDFSIKFHHNRRLGVFRRYWFTVEPNSQTKFVFATANRIDEHPRNTNEDEQEDIKKVKRAEHFLEFWESEFKQLCKRGLTEAERQMWVDPLLSDSPSLNTFTETWIIDTFFNPLEAKRNLYFDEKRMKNLE